MRITRKTRRPITREIRKFAREDGWSEEDIKRGYSYFNTQLGACRPYEGKGDGWEIHSALHVEVIGIMGVFNSDEEAALYGEKFFDEKIFHYDLGKEEEISLYWFVDEPTTRKTIEAYLAEKYGENHGFTPEYETINNQQKEKTKK